MPKQQKEHLGVYGVIINNKDEILLIKKARGPYKGLLDLPGGRPEFDEALEETLKREVLEETGLHVTACRQLETVVKIVEDDDEIIRHTGILYAAGAEGDLKTDSDGRDSEGALWINLYKITENELSAIAVVATRHKDVDCESN